MCILMAELDELVERVWKANLQLPQYGLVILTEGNVSGIDKARAKVAIKPSGVAYPTLKPDQISVVDIDGNKISGNNPSVDTPTHLEIYRRLAHVNAIVHTHSPYATIFAQRMAPIPCLGTTHADVFAGAVPVSRVPKPEELGEYEKNTGKIVCDTVVENVPAVLVAGHGPFVFGKSVEEALSNAAVLEKVAFLALHTLPHEPLPKHITAKHYERKNGPARYYGQK